MVVSGWSRSVLAARAAASKAGHLIRHQLITRNRRVAVGLAVVTVVISVAAVHVSQAWFSPGLLILPVLAGGLLLWPRALHILFAVIAAGLAYDVAMGLAGPGLVATIVVTALLADVLARTRKKLGMQGLRGNQMLIELRDRIRAQGTLPALPEGWGSVSVLKPAGGSSFGGLLGSVPQEQFLSSCNAYLRRGEMMEGFVTAVHLALDLTTGEYVVTSAGHPPAAHLDASSGTWRITQARGIVLGVVADLRLVPERGMLRPGDALMLYTDGLVEAPGRDIDYGTDRLLGEADRLVVSGFQQGAADLVGAMQGGTGGDDCALALIWRT